MRRSWFLAIAAALLPVFGRADVSTDQITRNIESIVERQQPSGARWRLALPKPPPDLLSPEHQWKDSYGLVRYGSQPRVSGHPGPNVYVLSSSFDRSPEIGRIRLVAVDQTSIHEGRRILGDGTEVFRRISMDLRTGRDGARLILSDRRLKTAGSVLIEPQGAVGLRVEDYRMVMRRAAGVFEAGRPGGPLVPVSVSDKVVDFFSSNPSRTIETMAYRSRGAGTSGRALAPAAGVLLSIDLEAALGRPAAAAARVALRQLAR
ncbi:MAG: hypothetical protein HYT79_00625 [Elusimicrobia bacterium]|nr:hypothetical protein [Elusimicrobiota bacterium]